MTNGKSQYEYRCLLQETYDSLPFKQAAL